MRILISGMLLSVLMLCLPACGPSEADASGAKPTRPLSFVVENHSGDQIRSIGMEGTEMPMGFRDLADGESASLSNKNLSLPQHLTLNWSDARGNRYAKRFNVWNELSSSYSGPITIRVKSRGKASFRGD